jgi:hypothetical protein
MRRAYLLALLLLSLSGCADFERHVTCAPRSQVVACLNESYQASELGLGPQCSALATWARAEGWEVQGVSGSAHTQPVVK